MWPGADRKDFGDNIFTLANDFASDSESRDKHIKKKGRNSERKKNFDVQGVQKWVKFQNVTLTAISLNGKCFENNFVMHICFFF